MVTSETRRRFESSVLPRLRRFGRRLRVYVAVDGAAVLTLAVVACIAGTFVIDRTLWLGRDMRTVQLVTLLIALAAITWRWMLRPLRTRLPDDELAILVEARYPQLGSRLVSAVEFVRGNGELAAARSPVLVDAVVRQAEAGTAALRFEDALAHVRFRQRGAIILLSLLALGVTWLVARETMGLWFQRNVLLRDVAWPLRNKLAIEGLVDGKLVIPRGDDVTLTALVEEDFNAPRQVYVDYAGLAGNGFKGRDQMPAVEGEATPRFTYTFERLSESIRGVVYGGDAPAQPFTIEVVDRPRVTDVVLAIEPPAYTKLPAYELRAGQTVAEALRGSRLRIRFRTKDDVREAVLIRQSGGEEQAVGEARRLSGTEFEVDDRPDASANYHFLLTDARGLTNVSERTPPVRVSLRLVPDKPPVVKMKVRGVGEMITPEAILPIETDFSDTYGLASARLVMELTRKDAKSPPVVEPLSGLEPGSRTFAHALEWSAPAHQLAEGDRVSLHAEAADFDDVAGPNVGASPTTILRVVSREELLAELNRREQEYRQDFERLIRQQEELYSEMLSLLGAASQADRARRFPQQARLQRDFAGRVTSIRLQFEQVLSELSVNQLLTPESTGRLRDGIIGPLGVLSGTRMARAAEGIDALARDVNEEAVSEARAAQEAVLTDMRRILQNMIRWEGFQEAVALLREVLKMQGKLSQETEKRIEAEVFGSDPAPGASNP